MNLTRDDKYQFKINRVHHLDFKITILKNNTPTYLTEKYLHLMDNIQYTYKGQPNRKTKTYFVLDIIIICATYQKIILVDIITLCTT